MTTTYDPRHPRYLDEADVRGDLARVFDACQECRQCLDLCDAFPTLFDHLDALGRGDAGLMTPAQQDRVGDGCHQCGMCVSGCPWAPGRHERALDFAGAMRRLVAMRRSTGQLPLRRRLAARVLGATRVMGSLGSMTAPWVNRLAGSPRSSIVRVSVSAVTGATAVRVLPPFARERFSTWFKARTVGSPMSFRRSVVLFPTCVVEYQAPGIGRDLVGVFGHNGIGCSLAGESRCCGATHLQTGDIGSFRRAAAALVDTLAQELKGTDSVIVVPQPTCAAVIRNDYPLHVGGPDAELVAERTVDPCDYLWGLGAGELSVEFNGAVPTSITLHRACHVRGAGAGDAARALLALTGARVQVVDSCAGLGGIWGFAAERDTPAESAGRRLGAAVTSVGGDAVAGDCHLANTVIEEHSGRQGRHPLQVLARAYGLTEDRLRTER